MSGATARANGATRSSRLVHSPPPPGLPCTNTTASASSAGPALRTGERTPPTATLRWVIVRDMVAAADSNQPRGPSSESAERPTRFFDADRRALWVPSHGDELTIVHA